jgi:invasion protein IalB
MRAAGRFIMVLLAGFGAAIATPSQAQTAADGWTRPMPLGRPFEAEASIRSVAPPSPAQKCNKWRRIADRLGETYAGVRLRRSVVERVCALADQKPSDDTVWSWPWRRGDIDADLPPRLHGTFETWTIRCAAVGVRERCALIHEGLATRSSTSTGPDGAARLITHFVIDDIGGQERLLWRVFVERAQPDWFANPAGWRPKRGARRGVSAVVGTFAITEPFGQCGRGGCLMEAEVSAGAKVAARLTEGADLRIDVQPLPSHGITRAVPAVGFAAGLKELVQLKRQERRLLAGNQGRSSSP